MYFKGKTAKDYMFLFINIACIYFIIQALYTIVQMYTVNRSLWLDEAMAAYSFSKRDFWNLTESIFEWNQSAPVLYLYIVKLITLIFGNTETTLRIFSFISYIAMLFMVYLLLKYTLKVKTGLLAAAFTSGIGLLLYYANEFKPYMTDAFAVLFVIFLYYLFTSSKLKWKYLILSYMILLWLSNPVCFFIAGIFLYEFIKSIKEKNTKFLKEIIVGGIFIFISFVIYFFYWLKPVMDAGEMFAYWENQSFPIIPLSGDDLERASSLITSIITHIGTYKVIFLIVSLEAMLVNFFTEKNKYIFVIFNGIIITLAASSFGMFPVSGRLFLFIYPIFVVLTFYVLGKLFENEKNRIFVLILIFIFTLANNTVIDYRNPQNVFQEEANPLIEYVRNNIKADEELYVYHHTVPVFEYKNGYGNTSIGGYENNVYLGTGFFNGETENLDTQYIFSKNKLYIIISHIIPDRIVPLMNSIQKKEYFDLIETLKDAKLYYKYIDLKDSKISCKYELTKRKVIDSTEILELTIINTGEAYLNNEYSTLKLQCTDENGKLLAYEIITDEIAPNQIYATTLSFNKTEYKKLKIELVNENRYNFEDLGIPPLIIEK